MNAYNHATFYSYDIHGNVDTLLQDFGFSGLSATANAMNKNNNRFKKTSYNYDLISGKVNLVMYQRGWNDQVLHRYSYDAENRLKLVETSFDSLRWETDARYEYYRHGPLARMVLGDQLLQGVDYAYTLQGWLKGVNSIALTTEKDMGQDGLGSGSNAPVARDVYGYQLNYFTADYAPINTSVDPLPGLSGLIPAQEYRPLYNGNISSMAVHQKALTGSSVVGPSALLYNYRYDQLNRLTAMDPYDGLNSGLPLTVRDQFQERIAYDPNGNILKYLRHGHLSSTNLVMDSLSYKYYPQTNQLRQVVDNVSAGRYGNLSADLKDIDPQTDPSNYQYDAIGNLVKDVQEGITSIKWTVYGKIKEITRVQGTTTTDIFYGYDPQGNRVSKLVQRNANGTLSKDYTYYVRDAQGNVMATYFASGTASLETLNLQLSERHFYGSSRLGYYNHKVSVDVGDLGPSPMIKPASNKYSRGYRQYELSNHLGNVLTVLMDKRLGIDNTSDGQIDYYDAVVTSANDYYPFGSMMPGRRFTSANTYRYGFNGKEEDDEAKGDGNQQDYGMRIYDPRVGKFLSVDPLTQEYPWYTPYQFAGNNPIEATDLDGAEPNPYHTMQFWKGFGNSVLKGVDNVITYVMNNPNHVGYGGGKLPSTGKPPTSDDVQRYEINWRQQLNPSMQIENFSHNLVYGATNFVGGIINGDGARVAQAIPQISSALGTMYGIANVLKVPSIPLVNTAAGVSQLRLTSIAEELAGKAGRKPWVISAITDARTGSTYVGTNRAIKSLDEVHPVLKQKLGFEKIEDWQTFNCAECDAFNQALNAGAKWEDLADMHTMKWNKSTKKYEDVERCKNCKVTFEDKTPTSEE